MKTKQLIFFLFLFTAFSISFMACEDDDGPGPMGTDPETAEEAVIDRFSEDAGTLMVRTESNGLPDAGEPINFDSGEPFITQGLGPGGQLVEYYNFDVQPVNPAPIYVLFHENGNMVEGQLNIINVIPGDAGYNDFWHVHRVTVPDNYVANTVTSMEDIAEAGYDMEPMNVIVNCPVVPEGSTASKRLGGEETGLVRGWYKDMVVFYFNFSEKELMPNTQGQVPVSPIYVTFNTNPDEDGGGPASGFVTEGGSTQTHNVVATLPEDAGYSPLWSVNAYDNAEFGLVYNLSTASNAESKGMGLANVNCPIVSIEDNEMETMNPDEAEEASIDRFSEDAGMLMVRTESNGLPGANEPIDYDSGEPFITQGLGPAGQVVQYYNFDVQPVNPAPIYVLFRDGEDSPVEGQLNIIDKIPGEGGYNDFWHVHKVTVPANYEANIVTSFEEIMNKKYPMEAMDLIVNCPVVPEGSTASKRLTDEEAGLVRGWYKDMVVYYFNFSEKQLMPNDMGQVPVSPIYVTFNINPGEDGGGPASGFVTEDMSVQTHNVVASLPSDGGYSPLWSVNPYDNADFDMVMDLSSASSANVLDMGVANVNCPIVSIEE